MGQKITDTNVKTQSAKSILNRPPYRYNPSVF